MAPLTSWLARYQPSVAEVVTQDEALASRTLWRTGGTARYLAQPRNLLQAQRLLAAAAENGLPLYVLGSGSNTLVAANGFPGLVLQTRALRQWRQLQPGCYETAPGVPLQQLARQAAAAGWQGLEQLAGIPGTVGGAVAGNAGAYGCSCGDFVSAVEWLSDQGSQWLDAAALQFGYRWAQLPPQGMLGRIRWRFQERQEPAALQQIRSQRLKQRHWQVQLPGSHVGSVFKNPAAGRVWELIDAAGWRGYRQEQWQVCWEHPNIIVNLGAGSSGALWNLIQRIQHSVWQGCAVMLELEPRICGNPLEGGQSDA